MIELPLVLAGGFLGSTHCIGMCGPLALVVGLGERSPGKNLRRQLAFSAGRVFTYGFLGAAAGFLGWWLSHQPTSLVNLQAAFALGAGVLLIVLGLVSAGILPATPILSHAPQLCSAASSLKTLLTSPGLGGAALAGVFTGFLPCGLVYAFLAFAASSGDIWRGWLIMVLFGIGTVPLMVGAGFSGSLFSVAGRRRIMQIAAWCVVLTGIITVARGMGYLELLTEQPQGGNCPFCASQVEG